MSVAVPITSVLSPTPLPAASPPSQAKRHLAFGIVCVTLVISAVLLNVLVPSLKISFRKLPVEPAEPIKSLKADLGPWAQVTVDRALSPDFEHELGATYYLFRDYVDTRKLTPVLRRKLLAASMEDREKMRADFGTLDSTATVRFALTYYTGAVDTVPHVPDRCYVADGFAPSTYQVVNWPVLPRTKEADRDAGVRLINFEDQLGNRQSRPTQVSYFFQVNGFYENDPIFGVRKRLQNLRDKYAYFAKIELRTDVASSEIAQPVMVDFLQNAMPDVERVLPQWVKKD